MVGFVDVHLWQPADVMNKQRQDVLSWLEIDIKSRLYAGFFLSSSHGGNASINPFKMNNLPTPEGSAKMLSANKG